MERMFHVNSVIGNVTYENKQYDNVTFNWFVVDRKEMNFDLKEMIINYSQLSESEISNAVTYLSELFTESEANQLLSELQKNSNGLSKIEEVKLPIPDNLKPYSSLKSESGKGFYDLNSKKSYNFPFKVRGFFNISDSFESLSGDDNPTEVTRLPKNFFKGK